VSSPRPTVADMTPLPGRGAATTQWAHVSETGVWPLVSPRRHESSATGRIQEWDREWRQRSQTMMDATVGWTGPAPDPAPPKLDAPLQGLAPGQKPIQCATSSSSSSASASASGRGSSFAFRIRVLAFDRVASLQRLLSSLLAADYLEDSGGIALEISVDRPAGEDLPGVRADDESESERAGRVAKELEAASRTASPLDEHNSSLSASARRLKVLSFLRTFVWPHGPLTVSLPPAHLGLVGQWLLAPSAVSRGDRDMALVLEDDLQLSTEYWKWVRGAVCEYYVRPAAAAAAADGAIPPEFDPALFGLSLQKQHYVLGQSVKNVQWQFLRYREEKSRAEAEALLADPSLATAPEEKKKESLAGAMGRIDPATLFEFERALGDPARTPVFRYQLLGTWGMMVFPSHWQPFLRWARAHLARNEAAIRARPPLANGALDSSLPLPTEPCVPHLEVSSWWSARPHAVWSAWFVRYTFQHGWYGLYPHLPAQAALTTSHREAGANHASTKGARDRLLRAEDLAEAERALGASEEEQGSLVTLPAPSPSSGHAFRYPVLASTPLFDFHFQRAANSAVLRQRAAMLTPNHFKRACSAASSVKDYARFEP